MNAYFRNAVYGPFVITGTLTTLAHGSLGIAGQAIETGTGTRRPVPELFALTPVPDHADVEPIPSTTPLSEVHHGDLVEAVFDQNPYGRFTLTGMALDAPAGGVLVLGSRFLTQPVATCSPAERLVAVTILEPAAEHGGAVPARIHRWPEPSPED
ncbi:hypothetical protein [Nocardia sp. NPDC057668]|uniref:hypothetical protein n=1 Tax=Nocardia sp. NPDC057668 TaxID=3346202 RepID=UPI003671005E